VAQLSFGLSTEYSKKPAQQDAKSDKVDADRQLYAKYYVSQIMQLGEEGIRDAWSKVGPGSVRQDQLQQEACRTGQVGTLVCMHDIGARRPMSLHGLCDRCASCWPELRCCSAALACLCA